MTGSDSSPGVIYGGACPEQEARIMRYLLLKLSTRLLVAKSDLQSLAVAKCQEDHGDMVVLHTDRLIFLKSEAVSGYQRKAILLTMT